MAAVIGRLVHVAWGTVVVVGAADEPELEGVHTQRRLIVETLCDGPTDKILNPKGSIAVGREALGVLEVGELVIGPERGDDLGVALDLHHLDQRLPLRAGFCIFPGQRVPGIVHRLEHHALAAVRVVGDRQKRRAVRLLSSHPGPELLLVHGIERAQRLIGHDRVAEDDVAVHVSAPGGGGPFEGDERCEGTGFIMRLGRRHDHIFPRGNGRLRSSEEGGMLRCAGAVVLDHVFQEPGALVVDVLQPAELVERLLRVARRAGDLGRVHLAKELCMVGHRREIERTSDIVQNRVHRHIFALGKPIGIEGREPRAADVGVEREGRVDVRLTEIGLLQRVGGNCRLSRGVVVLRCGRKGRCEKEREDTLQGGHQSFLQLGVYQMGEV